MYLIDTHCHLDALYNTPKLEEVIQNAQSKGISQMIAISTSPKDWLINQDIAKTYPNTVFHSIGLHPCYVDKQTLSEIKTIKSYLGPSNRYSPVALGECGLDYHHLDKDPQIAKHQVYLQKEAFEYQLYIALNNSLPIIIHSRDALCDCIHMIEASSVSWSRFIFHCFSYGEHELADLLERGARASFTGIITYKNAQAIRLAAKCQGLEKLILETDAPYLSPAPMRGKVNEPAYLKYTADFCASLFNVTPEVIYEVTTKNAQTFFKLPRP